MTDQLAFDTAAPATPLPPVRSRVAFTGGGDHWHGTVTRHLAGHDGKPRLDIGDISGSSRPLSGAVYRAGPHFRLTAKGEQCPDCGRTDPGVPLYSRP